MSTERNAMYSGTRANLSVLRKEGCDKEPPSFACNDLKQLTPITIVDFVPSLVADTVLLPVTTIHALTLPLKHKKTEVSNERPTNQLTPSKP